MAAKRVRGAPPASGPEPTSVHDYSGETVQVGPGQRRWWDREECVGVADVGTAMVNSARNIEKSPAEQLRYDLNLLYGSLYEGRELSNLYQYGGAAAVMQGQGTAIGPGAIGQVTWNVIRSVVQTVASQVARSRPRARFVTSGGNLRQKRRAKKLTAFCDGLFEECRVYEKTQQAFVAAGAFDVAGIQVYRDGDRVGVELVRACEIMISANDGIDGRPRAMYRRKFVDKGVLMAKFGKGRGREEARAAIARCRPADPVGDGSGSSLIEVYEAWHLPSGDNTEDGWHVIALETATPGDAGATLLVEPYEKRYFPIILFTIDQALSGPYGVSAAAVLLPIQIAINVGLDKIARAQHLAARPGVFMPISAKIPKGGISSAIGQVTYYAGTTPPTFYTPQVLSAEVYEQLERHFERAFALYGVNTQVAAGTKEAGTTSAVAIRESLDVQTARFAVLAQRWERLHVDIARIAIDVARDIYADSKEMRVQAPGTALLESIDWKDVDLEEDEYVIQVYPTSLLPTTPQGRIDRVTELVTSGIWPPQRAAAALDDLDMESAMSADRAAEKDVEQMCEEMLVDGKAHQPDATDDLGACLRIAAQYLHEGRTSVPPAPEKNLDLLYRFLDEAAYMQAQLKGGGGAPQTGGAGPASIAPPGAAPAPGGPAGPLGLPPAPGGEGSGVPVVPAPAPAVAPPA